MRDSSYPTLKDKEHKYQERRQKIAYPDVGWHELSVRETFIAGERRWLLTAAWCRG
jgi:hypothetical protein